MHDRTAGEEPARRAYARPEIVSAYSKAEIAELIRPHGTAPSYGDNEVMNFE